MTKHRTSRRRSQKGGDWYNPSSWFGSSDPNAVEQGWGSWLTGATQKASGALTTATDTVKEGANSAVNGATEFLNSDVKLTEATEAPYVASTQSSVYPAGGRRKRKMKGGKGGLGLTPVSGLHVATPTYWIQNQYIKGGSRRKRRQRKSRKSKKSRKSRKTRRH